MPIEPLKQHSGGSKGGQERNAEAKAEGNDEVHGAFSYLVELTLPKVAHFIIKQPRLVEIETPESQPV